MVADVKEPAPDFVLPGTNGEKIRLSDFRGKYVVVYFYPKDMTPGCTTEACDFRDAYDDFSDLDAVIIGISPDSIDRHQKFIDKHELPFHLLADENHQVASEYDVWKLKKNFGKEYYGIERSTFIVDPEGNILKAYRKVRVKGHVDEALSFIRNLN